MKAKVKFQVHLKMDSTNIAYYKYWLTCIYIRFNPGCCFLILFAIMHKIVKSFLTDKLVDLSIKKQLLNSDSVYCASGNMSQRLQRNFLVMMTYLLTNSFCGDLWEYCVPASRTLVPYLLWITVNIIKMVRENSLCGPRRIFLNF